MSVTDLHPGGNSRQVGWERLVVCKRLNTVVLSNQNEIDEKKIDATL